MRLPPFQQGGLDSLCGLYSLVNADLIINASSRKQSQALFNSTVDLLHRRGQLHKILVEGTALNTMNMLLRRNTKEHGAFASISTPWRGVTTPTLPEFWQSLRDFMGPKKAIVICLRGYHDHWTVIREISNSSMWLYDSGGINRLPRDECSTTKDPRRKHLLRPAQTYFVSGSGERGAG